MVLNSDHMTSVEQSPVAMFCRGVLSDVEINDIITNTSIPVAKWLLVEDVKKKGDIAIHSFLEAMRLQRCAPEIIQLIEQRPTGSCSSKSHSFRITA